MEDSKIIQMAYDHGCRKTDLAEMLEDEILDNDDFTWNNQVEIQDGKTVNAGTLATHLGYEAGTIKLENAKCGQKYVSLKFVRENAGAIYAGKFIPLHFGNYLNR